MKTARNRMTFAAILFCLGLAVTFSSVQAEEGTTAPAKPVAKHGKKHRTAHKKSKTKTKKKISVKAPAPKKETSVQALLKEDEAAPDTLQGWAKALKKKLVHQQAKQNQLVAVASVRGDETPDAPPLYWKGRSTPGIAEGSDTEELDQALNKILEGDNTSAKMRLESFISTHGQSQLLADAKESLKRVNEAPATPAAQPKPDEAAKPADAAPAK
jgi:hypothetical protein